MSDYADRFHEAFLHQPSHTVLGFRLRPFCLWHCLLLEVAGNPVLARGAAADFPALEQAAWICSHGYGPLGEVPRRGFRGFARRYRYLTQLDLERAAMRAYLDDYFSAPRLWSGKGQPVKTPWQLYRVAQLVRWGNWTAEQAWLMPIGEAVWYAAALSEVEHGQSSLVSEGHYEAMVEAGVWEEDG